MSSVTRQIAGDIESMVGSAEKGAARIRAAFNAAADASLALAKGFGAITAIGVGVAAYSIKAASDLEYQLNLLQTHAGFAQNDTAAIAAYAQQQAALGNALDPTSAALGYQNQQVGLLRQGLLTLGPQVGYTATELAQAAYFASSEGVQFHSASEMLNILTAGAETAQMTHADLDQTMKTLAQTMGVFGKNLANPAAAAGELNAIVGQGVMTFDQFNTSLKTGFLGVAGATNQSLSEMGGMLDYLTTSAFGASQGTTGLRFDLMSLTSETNAHGKALKSLGIDQENLVNMMVNDPNGFLKALELLQSKLSALPGGLRGAQAINIEGILFGQSRGKTPIMAMLDNLDAVKARISDIEQQASTFGAKWSQTAQQPAVMMQMFNSSIYSARVALGEALLPMFTELLTRLTPVIVAFGQWIDDHQKLIEQWAPFVLKILAGATAFFALTGGVLKFIAWIDPLRLALLGVVAVVAFLVSTWSQWGGALGNVGNQINSGIGPALSKLGGVLSGTILPAFQHFGGFVVSAIVPAFKAAQPHIASFIDAVAKAAPKIMDFVVGVGEKLVTAMSKVPWGNLIDALRGVFNGFVTALPSIEKFAGTVFDAIGQALPFAVAVISTIANVVSFLAAHVIGPIVDVAQWLQQHLHLITLIFDVLIARFLITKALNPFLEALGAAKTFIGHLGTMKGLLDMLIGKDTMKNLSGLFSGGEEGAVQLDRMRTATRGLGDAAIDTSSKFDRLLAARPWEDLIAKIRGVTDPLANAPSDIDKAADAIDHFRGAVGRLPTSTEIAGEFTNLSRTDQTTALLQSVLGRPPTAAEITDQLGMSPGRMSEVTNMMRTRLGTVRDAISSFFRGGQAGFMDLSAMQNSLTSLGDTAASTAARIRTSFTGVGADLTAKLSVSVPADLGSKIGTQLTDAIDKANIGQVIANDTSRALKNASVGTSIATDVSNAISHSSMAQTLADQANRAKVGTTVVGDIENAVGHSSVLQTLLGGVGGKALGGLLKVGNLLAQPVYVVNWPGGMPGSSPGSEPGGGPAPVTGLAAIPDWAGPLAVAAAGIVSIVSNVNAIAANFDSAKLGSIGIPGGMFQLGTTVQAASQDADRYKSMIDNLQAMFKDQGLQQAADVKGITDAMQHAGISSGQVNDALVLFAQEYKDGQVQSGPQMQQFLDLFKAGVHSQSDMTNALQTMQAVADQTGPLTQSNMKLLAGLYGSGVTYSGYLVTAIKASVLSGQAFANALAPIAAQSPDILNKILSNLMASEAYSQQVAQGLRQESIDIANAGLSTARGAPVRYARGGPVTAHRPYLVGEEGWEIFKPTTGDPIMVGTRGPALFEPDVGGRIIPHELSVAQWPMMQAAAHDSLDRLMPTGMGEIYAIDRMMASALVGGVTPMAAGGIVGSSSVSWSSPTDQPRTRGRDDSTLDEVRSLLSDIREVLKQSYELQRQPAPGDDVSSAGTGFRTTATGLAGLLYVANQKAQRSRRRGIRTERLG